LIAELIVNVYRKGGTVNFGTGGVRGGLNARAATSLETVYIDKPLVGNGNPRFAVSGYECARVVYLKRWFGCKGKPGTNEGGTR
jgi:hypothetical protein